MAPASYTFGLFGIDLTLIVGKTDITSIGGVPVVGQIVLGETPHRLQLGLHGKLCGVGFDIAFDAPFDAGLDGRIRLKGFSSSALKGVTVELAGEAPAAVLNPQLTVSADASIGIEIVDPNGVALSFLAQPGRLPPGLRYAAPDRSLRFYPDLRGTKVVCHSALTDRHYFEVQDLFAYDTGPGGGNVGARQRLDIADLIFDPHSYALTLRPHSGAMFAHADVLDTSARKENQVLFQYALVNGMLSVSRSAGEPTYSMTWNRHPTITAVPAVILLRYQDEHGHPVAFEFANATTPIAIRSGVGGTVISSQIAADWDQTNRAFVIGAHKLGEALIVSGKLRRLDPRELYRAYADESDLLSITQPPFIVNGVAPIQPEPPAEIHGLRRGTWLRQSTVGGADASGASLIVEPHVVGADTLFHHTELKLDQAQAWTLLSLREERDYKPEKSATAGSAVGCYKAQAKNGDLSLPSIDLSFAVSNLAGDLRRSSKGVRMGEGGLYAAVGARLASLESQFSGPTPARFELPTSEDQRHTSGVRLQPVTQPFARVLDHLPTSAPTAAETGRIAPDLQSQKAPIGMRVAAAAASTATYENSFVFGGNTASSVRDIVDHLRKDGEAAHGALGDVLSTFERKWRGLASDPRVRALRTMLLIEERPSLIANPGEFSVRLANLLDAAVVLIASNRNIDDITSDAEGLLRFLNDLTPEDLVGPLSDYWTSPDPELALLWEHVWCPGDADLFRRIARLSLTTPLDTQLKIALFGADVDFKQLLTKYLDAPADGLLAALRQGVDETWDKAVDYWKTMGGDVMEGLRRTYGPYLTRDVYQRLLQAAKDASLFLDAIRNDIGIDIARLADLSSEPPEYVLRTRRFPVKRTGQEEALDALWNQCFDLCAFPSEAPEQNQLPKLWSFFLDSGTTLIVKLSRKRGLDLILREIVAEYADGGRSDPLGLEQPVDAFVTSLDPDLLTADWVGVLLIRPVANISRDVVLRDLVGFDHIAASYIAVGGRQPTMKAGTVQLDVWAHIFKEQPANRDLAGDKVTAGDVKLALTKFDVRIRQTQLSDADIKVEIYAQDVFGRKSPTQKDGAYPVVVLRGALEPAQADGSARGLSFSAYFPDPMTLDIDIAFVKSLKLNTLRVARLNGATCIDIDGDIELQDPPPILGLDLGIEKGQKLHLQNFRIPLPSLPGVKVEVGVRRQLMFDLPSINFALPKPRAFNLFGIEMTPRGLGYVRGKANGAELDKLRNDYMWLGGFQLGGGEKEIYVPYIEYGIDFGKFPNFGDSDIRGLRFDMVIAFKVEDGYKVTDAYLGLSGLDAKHVKLDFFRILTLQIEKELRISQALLSNGSGVQAKAGAILAKDISLKILNWSPLDEKSELDLLMLHSPEGLRSLLAFYAASTDPPADSFFNLFWLLLAHNLELPNSVLSYLLETGPAGGKVDLLLKLEPPQNPNGFEPLKLDGVKQLERESWLFGMSFGLGKLFSRCNLVLHDQHYYGIHLWADWVKPIFGMESLELAYMPGATRNQDRFRMNLPVPALDMLGFLKSGEVALEWGVNWDFLVDIGFPWRTEAGYDWFRSFSIPMGAYEGKFGFYVEKRTAIVHDANTLTLSAGVGFYVGYYFGSGNSVAWVRAGIGIFAIVQGSMTFGDIQDGSAMAALKGTLIEASITGVIGIFAYGEGGVDVWILSARFRVSAQASVSCTIIYHVKSSCVVTYTAELEASYSASVRVGCGFCSWTFSISGQVGMPISGRILLS